VISLGDKRIAVPDHDASPQGRDDPDFPEAKQTVKKALILWAILSAVHVAVLAKSFL